jgi:hypothetical protein
MQTHYIPLPMITLSLTFLKYGPLLLICDLGRAWQMSLEQSLHFCVPVMRST